MVVCSRHLSSTISTPQTRPLRREPLPKQPKQLPRRSGHPLRLQGTVRSARMGPGRRRRRPGGINRVAPAAYRAPLVRAVSRQERAMLPQSLPSRSLSPSGLADDIYATQLCPIRSPATSPRSIDRPCAPYSCARYSMGPYARRRLRRRLPSVCWRSGAAQDFGA
jgi:hypothetical protein